MNANHDIRVEFLFDFGSPNAYLCHKVIPAIEAQTGVRFTYLPILLGGLFKLANNRSPVEAFAAIPNKLAYDQVEMRRFVTRHGLKEFKLNPHFPVNTLPIMRGAVAAQRLGCFERYVDSMFVAMWECGLKMDEPAAIAAVLTEGGMDAERLLQAAQEPEVKGQLTANTQASHDRGAFGSPTFFVGDEMFFGKERMRDVAEELVRLRQVGKPGA
jgi:2-hydroxychromene-2-carboxylate isomerase